MLTPTCIRKHTFVFLFFLFGLQRFLGKAKKNGKNEIGALLTLQRVSERNSGLFDGNGLFFFFFFYSMQRFFDLIQRTG